MNRKAMGKPVAGFADLAGGVEHGGGFRFKGQPSEFGASVFNASTQVGKIDTCNNTKEEASGPERGGAMPRMLRSEKAVLTDRLHGALLTFKTMHDWLLQARACAEVLSAADADAFWAGQGRCIKQHADAAAWWATTVYKAYVVAGLAGCVGSGDRALVIAANRYLDQEAHRLGKLNGEQNVSG